MNNIKEFKRLVDRSGIAELTLFNSDGEWVYGGNATDVIVLNGKLKFKWSVPEVVHYHPFSFAMLHQGGRLLSMLEIAPVWIEGEHKIELVFDYEQ